MTYVLDASAALRYRDNEQGADRVEELLLLAQSGRCVILIPAVNWGEVAYILNARPGESPTASHALNILRLAVDIVDATEDRVVRAGILKNKYNISYADAFGVELASDSSDHTLITADYGVKPAETAINIEFLPSKPKP